MKRILMCFMLMPFMAFATTLNDGLVAWYKFDGDANDSSGNDYNFGVNSNVYVCDRNGNENSACYFTGEQFLYRDRSYMPTNSFTFACWVKPEGWIETSVETSSGMSMLYDTHPLVINPGGAWMGNDSSGVGLAVGTNGIAVIEGADCYYAPTLLARGDYGSRWLHVVVIVSENSAPCLYVDGVWIKTGLQNGRTKVLGAGAMGGTALEDNNWGYRRNYKGCIDDVRIYNRALSVEEVKVLYTQTLYVDGTSGSDDNYGTSPTAAKKTIQAAIDVAVDGDTILVAPGTYAPIETSNKVILVRGAEGAAKTIIDAKGFGICAQLGYNRAESIATTLEGFTLINGYRDAYEDPAAAIIGGRAKCCIVRNCTGWAIVHASHVENCLIYNNTATHFGVIMHGETYNCTIINNEGRAAWDNGFLNCIVHGDIYQSSGQQRDCCTYCCLSKLRAPEEGNFVADPKFLDAANGDYRLAAGSQCIDAGDNSYVVGDKDLEGCGRIVNGTVDIGCYEFEPDGGPYKETVGDIEWTYTIKGGRASVGDGTVAAAENLTGAVSVPTWLRQRPVNAIDDNAFVDCNAMTSLTIPAGIKTMGDSVFEGCSGLKDLYIESDTLSSVGADVFKWCHWDLIVHVPATWQGRGRTLGGYSVWKAGSSDEDKSVSVTVTNVVVQYVLNSVKSEIAVPVCGETGFVTVITEITSSGAVSIPVEWKDNFPLFEAKFGTDFANALRTKSGKKDCANNELLVWQDFVAGTDPTDEDDVFTASITMVGGKPMISYTPELSAEETAKRVYTISGKKSLTDGSDWEVVEPGTEADYNFFKVSVRMK